jgi:hypothetical protein
VQTLPLPYSLSNSAAASQKGKMMTSFVHVDYPSEHPGVVRVERAAQSLKGMVLGFDASRTGASLLLAAIVAALMVVASQVVETWSEGHLLAAWILLWAVAFAALALLAAPARRAAVALRVGLKRRAEARKRAAEDEQLWQLALTDARVMADINRAMSSAALRDLKAYY